MIAARTVATTVAIAAEQPVTPRSRWRLDAAARNRTAAFVLHGHRRPVHAGTMTQAKG